MCKENYEKIARLAQKYTENVPVIILGTGATIPFGLPCMNDLAEHLIQNVSPENHDTYHWETFKTDLTTTKDLERTLHNIQISDTLLSLIVLTAWQMIKQKDLELIKRILCDEQKLPLTDLLTHFLRTANPHISIITTNYDRMAEYAADLAQASAFTGFTEGYLQRFAASIPRTHNKIDVWKVHGSLDWFLSPDEQIIKYPFENIPEGFTPLIVTPGVSKYRIVHKDPFRAVLASSDLALNKAKSYLCVGYGFNDEHVQPVLIRRAKSEKIPLVVITKNLTSKAKEVIGKGVEKYLFIEEYGAGSKIFSNEFPAGINVPDLFWKTEEFIKLII